MLIQLPKYVQHVLLCTVVASLTAPIGTVFAAPNPGGSRQRDVFGGYVSTQIVVKLRPEAMATAAARQHFQTAAHDSDPRAALSGRVRTAATQWRTKRMRPAYSEPFSDPALAAKYGMDRTFIIEVPEGTDTEAMAAAFAALGGDIESATVDTIGGVADFIPNDTSFSLQYAMNNTGQTGGVVDADIDAPAAWDLHTGDFGTVTIAIIDSGVDSHPDLGNNVGPYPNGRFVEGRNTNNPLTPTFTTDGCPHGTHVAGIAAATGNNGAGVAGVTWGAYIMPVRVLTGCGGPVSALAAGIKWAADHGADVGNMSLQYYGLTQVEYDLLNNAVNYAHDLGMVLVAAAGNNQTRCVGGTNHNSPCSSNTECPGVGGTCVEVVSYPAKLLNCMGVSATTDDDLFASLGATGGVWFSNFGNEIDVCAPGDRIYSTWTFNTYTLLSGTSMATPHVTGLAALIKSYVPELTNTDIESILMSTADDKGPVGWDKNYGFGRINAYSALLAAETWPVCGNGVIDIGEECDPGSDVSGDCCTGACLFESAGFVCRSAAGACDIAETCSGSSETCPADLDITSCIDSDGCCPSGCNSTSDNDCPVVTVLKWESVLTHSPNQPVPVALEILDNDLFSEPRSGIEKVVITFDGQISSATAIPQNVTICGNDSAGSPVDLSGVSVSTAATAGDTKMEIIFTPELPNFARYRIAINMNIQSADGGSVQAGVGGLSRILTALQGDCTGDRRVNATDLGGARAQVGINPIDPATLIEVRSDVNNDGRINATDLGLIRGRVSQDAQSILDPVCP